MSVTIDPDLAAKARTSLQIGAYWGPREASLDDCATRLGRTLDVLAKVSPWMSRWKDVGRSEAELLSNDWLNLSKISNQLWDSIGVGVDGKPVTDVGYKWRVWNGNEQAPIDFNIRGGSWLPHVSNVVLLRLPYQDLDVLGELYDRQTVRSLLVSFADVWDADWAVATSDQLREEARIRGSGPTIGWFTYLSQGRPIPEDLPAEVQTGPHGGHVIVVPGATWDNITSDVVKPVAQALDDAGALGPTR